MLCVGGGHTNPQGQCWVEGNRLVKGKSDIVLTAFHVACLHIERGATVGHLTIVDGEGVATRGTVEQLDMGEWMTLKMSHNFWLHLDAPFGAV